MKIEVEFYRMYTDSWAWRMNFKLGTRVMPYVLGTSRRFKSKGGAKRNALSAIRELREMERYDAVDVTFEEEK